VQVALHDWGARAFCSLWLACCQRAAQPMISSAKLRSSCSTRAGHPATCRTMRATCSRSPLASFLFDERAHRALIGRWLERVHEIPKPFGENFRPKFPVMSHAWRDDVMSKQSVPALPEVPVHHSINIMEMDSLKRFQKLVGSMEKSRALFD